MLYYRFRPASELALNELLYSEMFFTSTEECNARLGLGSGFQNPSKSRERNLRSPRSDEWLAAGRVCA